MPRDPLGPFLLPPFDAVQQPLQLAVVFLPEIRIIASNVFSIIFLVNSLDEKSKLWGILFETHLKVTKYLRTNLTQIFKLTTSTLSSGPGSAPKQFPIFNKITSDKRNLSIIELASADRYD